MKIRNCIAIGLVAGMTQLASSATSPWWSAEWKERHAVEFPAGLSGWVRLPFPKGASPAEIRCIRPAGKLLPFWIEGLDVGRRAPIALEAAAHLGFPRMVKTKTGELLLFYRRGTSHAFDNASIVMRRSSDVDSFDWSAERELYRDPESGVSPHNPVALTLPSGRILLWISRFHHSARPMVRLRQVWIWSDDNGESWSKPEVFDSSRDHTCYYVTDAIRTSDGFLAGSNNFNASGVGGRYNSMYHSPDGEVWQERSRLPIGDEVGLLELQPGRILCLQRDYQRRETYVYRSEDGGRTWSEAKGLRKTVGVLQRAVLHRVREGHDTILLFGRDATRKQMVVFVSRDNGETFGERQVIDSYARDGAYGTAQSIGASLVSFAWYSDSDTPSGQPNIIGSKIVVHEPRWLWVNLDATSAKESRFHVYTGNPKAEPLEFFAGTVGRPPMFLELDLGAGEASR